MLGWRETQARIEIRDKRVLGCRDVTSEKTPASEPPGGDGEEAKRQFLDAASEDAAAHDPAVDRERVPFFPADADRNDSVVAKPVPEPETQDVSARITRKRRELRV